MAKKKKAKKTKNKAVAKKAKKAPKKRRIVARASRKKAAAKRGTKKTLRGRAAAGELVGYQRRGLGGITGGQSGDTQGLSAVVHADSESVEELLEEGQTFEAEAIAGVENAPDPDQSEVVTREFPEDDVPEEYRERDQ